MKLSDLKNTSPEFSTPFSGTIRLGRKKKSKNGKDVPTATDHFVIKGETEGEKLILEHYGDNPKELVVFLPPFSVDIKLSDFPSQFEYQKAYINMWKDKIMTIRYIAYSAPARGTRGGSLLFIGDDNGGIIKDPDFYKKLLGKNPEGKMPDGGWKITFNEGGSWDDHEEFQKMLNDPKGAITINCTIRLWVDPIITGGVFRIVTRSISTIKNLNQYIDGLISSQGNPKMVATVIRKEQIKVKKNGQTMTPYIVKFEQANDWSDISKKYMTLVAGKRREVDELIKSVYGTPQMNALDASTEESINENLIELDVSEYADADAEEAMCEEVVCHADEEGTLQDFKVDKSTGEITDLDDKNIYTKQHFSDYVKNVGICKEDLNLIILNNKRIDDEEEHVYIKRLTNVINKLL